MEIRILNYFLAVAREGNFSAAAKSLHVTQPTLSRQLKSFEDELGTQLLIRGSKKVTLTEEGMLFRKRAQEIIDMVEKTESEIGQTDLHISGDIYIGCGETEAMRLIAKTVNKLQQSHPRICVHLFSGNRIDVLERLDKGLLDFGVLVGPLDLSDYSGIKLPFTDVVGVLMRKDSHLATLKVIKPEDLNGLPLMIGQTKAMQNAMSDWLGTSFDSANIVATFNLIFNAALMVEEGVGYALSLDKLTPEGGVLCFKPLEPRLEVNISIVWKRHQVFSKASQKFLEQIKIACGA